MLVRQDGENWFGNIINWYIGYIIMAILTPIGNFLQLFLAGQAILDMIFQFATDFKAPLVSDNFMSELSYMS